MEYLWNWTNKVVSFFKKGKLWAFSKKNVMRVVTIWWVVVATRDRVCERRRRAYQSFAWVTTDTFAESTVKRYSREAEKKRGWITKPLNGVERARAVRFLRYSIFTVGSKSSIHIDACVKAHAVMKTTTCLSGIGYYC